MKLICEVTEEIKVIKEGKDNAPKSYYIEGVFLQAELKNRNGRMYPKELLEKEIERYNKEYIEKSRAFGELGHPDGPTINLDRVSHMITEMRAEGNNFIGKAKIMNTPMGNIVKALIDEGARLGVSSRGMGSIKTEGRDIQIVQDDFYLATAADIVADPSAPDAFVNGIMEGKEWVWNNGVLQEREVSNIKKAVSSSGAKQIKQVSIQAFENFLNKLSGKQCLVEEAAVRSLDQIAREIMKLWKNPYFGAVPYLQAMLELQSVKDKYYMDSGRDIVLYFLSNATAWKGEDAKRIKAELKGMLK